MQTYYPAQPQSDEMSVAEVFAWITGVVAAAAWVMAAWQGFRQVSAAGETAVVAPDYVALFINRWVLVAVTLTVWWFVVAVMAALSYLRRR